MIHAVRCPSCRNLSRVGGEAVGETVACPHCERPFTAVAEPPLPPEGRPSRPRPAPPDDVPVVHPFRPDPFASGHDGPPVRGPSPTLIGLGLLPLGIPLLWLAAFLTGREPVFTFAAPVAVALGVCGLGLGIGFADGWSVATRVKAVLAVAALGYLTAGFLFALKKEWAEEVRAKFEPAILGFTFEPPDKAYRVELPAAPAPAGADRPLAGWKLEAFRCAPDPRHSNDTFEVAHGPAPAELAGPKADDEAWFAAARAAVQAAAGGAEVVGERPVTHKRYPGREYTLADGATNRIVQVFRVGGRAFCLAVEGPFVTVNAPLVKAFFRSFLIAPP